MSTGLEALSGGEAAPTADLQTPAPAAQTPATTEQKTDPQPAAEPAPDAKWYAGLPPERHAYIENKGWTSPADMFESYTNIEKTLGLPADARSDALLVRPKADAKPEEQAAFLDKATKAFVPESPDKYDLGLTPEQMTPELEASTKWMHEAGLPQPMAARLAAQYTAGREAAEAAFEAQSAKDMTELATELGDKFGDFEEMSRRAYRAAKEQSGFTTEQTVAMEKAIGTKAMLKLFGAFGKNMGELPGPGGQNIGQNGGQFTQSPQQAQAKIQNLMQDSEFMARYTSPNIGKRQAAIAEMEALQKAATGTA